MSQEVDQSRRRIVKAAYAAPTLAVLGMVTSMNASGSPPPPPDQGQGAGEPDDYDLDAGNDCGRWLSPDCID